MGNVLAHHGQRACPCWADLLSDKCPKVNVVIPIFLFSGFSRLLQFLSAEFLTSDKSFHLTITFISKPSRQLADNRQTVNHLVIRILQPKTRQSDGFLQFLGNMTFEVNWGEISTNYWLFELLMDNWAVCDIISSTVFAKYKEEELAKIKTWSKSPHVYNLSLWNRDTYFSLPEKDE